MNPKRTCILCRNKKDKSDLFRIVQNNFEALYDNTQKINTRGIYICKDIKCIESCINKLHKDKLNVKISINKESFNDVLEHLKNEVEEM